jgi:hypothetical protein
MALTDIAHVRIESGQHFWVRFGGLTGLLVVVVGLVLLQVGATIAGVALLVVGGAGVIAALGYESKQAYRRVAGRRSAAGGNAAVQALLAVLLVVIVNAFSFWHYHRSDWTADGEFTIPADIKDRLARLTEETTIVVHLTHNPGHLGGKFDEYDHAAARVVIDKVEDMVEQFREFGPQFRVTVLDTKDKRYRDKLHQATSQSKELAGAIKESSEDSIFLVAGTRVERVGFPEIFQLDKKKSRAANGGRGNLVMNYQGIEPFARKVLNLEGRKPRIAFGVVHEAFSTKGAVERYGMPGVKKALAANGFESQDIILKTGLERGPGEPAVFTFDENRYENLSRQIANLNGTIRIRQKDVKTLKHCLDRFRDPKVTTKALNKEFGSLLDQVGVEEVTPDNRVLIRERVIRRNLDIRKVFLEDLEKQKKNAEAERSKLNVSDLARQRHTSDLKAKFERKLADCDLLVLPRMTLYDVTEEGGNLPNRLYYLDPAQEDAIKDFLRQGKPILALFGPTIGPGNMPDDVFHRGPRDRIEPWLRELGVNLGRETVLFDVETQSFGQRRGSIFIQGPDVEVPPVEFTWQPGAHRDSAGKNLPPNPLARSLQLTAGSVDEKEGQADDLRLKLPRPVDVDPLRARGLRTDPVFLMTDPNGWKEARPFPTPKGPPQPNPQTSGQWPIGVALEARLPKSWNPDQKTVRVAVIGHGGVFIGNQLSPARERLLVDTCNWLLGREEMLNREHIPWEFPRIALSENAKHLWVWATWLGIPALFFYLGVVVLMRRSLR